MGVQGKNASVWIDTNRGIVAQLNWEPLKRAVALNKITTSLADEAVWKLERALAEGFVLAGFPEDDEALYE